MNARHLRRLSDYPGRPVQYGPKRKRGRSMSMEKLVTVEIARMLAKKYGRRV